VEDCNRVYRLFEKRNPGFNERGKTHLIAHSLGSALAVDILSHQPTYTPLLKELSDEQLHSNATFVFDTSNVFFMGSPCGFLFFLNGARLVARKGRARTKDVSADLASDKPQYGCLAAGAFRSFLFVQSHARADSLYNIYIQTDPVAYLMNPAVDAAYSKKLKAAPVQAQTTSMLESVSQSMYKLFEGVSLPRSLWTSAAATKAAEAQLEAAEAERKAELEKAPIVVEEETESDKRAKKK
jgi:hypothetical protein